MQNEEDNVNIKGNCVFNSGGTSNYATDGKICIGGNCVINTSSFNPTGESKIIFNGTEKQTIDVKYTGSYFNRPLAKLNRHIKVADTSKQGKTESKSLSSITVSF